MAEEKNTKYTPFREKIIDEIRKGLSNDAYDNPTERDNVAFAVIDKINEIKDNAELAKFLRVQNSFISQMLETKDTPTLSKLLHTDPAWRQKGIDFIGLSGRKDILDKYLEVPKEDIDYYAAQLEMGPKDFQQKLYEAGLKNARYKIAHGEDLGGWFDSPEAFANNLGGAATTVFLPRSQEDIEDGRSPSAKDVGLDLGQDFLYAIPYGGIAGKALQGTKLAAKLAGDGIKQTVAKGAGNVVLNAFNPLVMEAADAALYNEDENADRSKFSIADAGIGTMINTFTPAWLARNTGRIKHYLTGSENEVGSQIAKAAEKAVSGKSGSLLDDMYDREQANKIWMELKHKIDKNGLESLTADEKAFYNSFRSDNSIAQMAAHGRTPETQKLQAIDESSAALLKQGKGNTFENTKSWYENTVEGLGKKLIKDHGSKEKALKWIVNNYPESYDLISTVFNLMENPEIKNKVISGLANKLGNNLEKSIYKGLDNIYISPLKYWPVESTGNIITNHAGDMKAEELPIVGNLIKQRKEDEDVEADKKAREEAYKKYGINFMLGGR